jgi:hypothetical protein
VLSGGFIRVSNCKHKNYRTNGQNIQNIDLFYFLERDWFLLFFLGGMSMMRGGRGESRLPTDEPRQTTPIWMEMSFHSSL